MKKRQGKDYLGDEWICMEYKSDQRVSWRQAANKFEKICILGYFGENEWIWNEWMNGFWMNEFWNEWMNFKTNEWFLNEWILEWMDKLTNESWDE